MRVLIKAFAARQGGGQTYLRNLLSIPPPDGGMEIFLLAPESFLLPPADFLTRIHTSARVENPLRRVIWEKSNLPRLIRKLQIDVLFCPSGPVYANVPRGCKTVTMCRNMLPFDYEQRRQYPLGYQRLRNWMLERILLRSMKQTDMVIFISEYARQAIAQRMRGGIRSSVTIPHGINPHFREEQVKHLPRPAWLGPENYLLYVSTLDFYKAQIQVIQAFSLLKQRRRTTEKLVLTGPENPQYGKRVRSEIARLNLSHDVILTGQVGYAELPALYHHALINIFASRTENCPNILLEALAAARPIVCSNRSAMPEFGGDAVLYFDPSRPEELAAHLLGLIDNPSLQEDLCARARRRAAVYDWAQTSRQTWRVIQDLHGGRFAELCAEDASAPSDGSKPQKGGSGRRESLEIPVTQGQLVLCNS